MICATFYLLEGEEEDSGSFSSLLSAITVKLLAIATSESIPAVTSNPLKKKI